MPVRRSRRRQGGGPLASGRGGVRRSARSRAPPRGGGPRQSRDRQAVRARRRRALPAYRHTLTLSWRAQDTPLRGMEVTLGSGASATIDLTPVSDALERALSAHPALRELVTAGAAPPPPVGGAAGAAGRRKGARLVCMRAPVCFGWYHERRCG